MKINNQDILDTIEHIETSLFDSQHGIKNSTLLINISLTLDKKEIKIFKKILENAKKWVKSWE